jgi:hypothetical protein
MPRPRESTDNLAHEWRQLAEERSSMLEDNRNDEDQKHYDRLGQRLDRISEEMKRRGVKDW